MSGPPAAPPLLTRDRLLLWGGFLAAITVAPLVYQKGFVLSLLCQIGIMTVFALSYNILLGQTGLLSFGHAVYYGFGAFTTIHVLNLATRGAFPFPITLLPLVGGLSGLLFAAVFGYVTTRRAGTPFAMISLGIGEMAAASSLMFPGFFGGEGGISGNRVTSPGLLGITYGPQLQMYYLIAGWGFACMLAMYALAHTPLGRIANAVRDNPERAQFVGYDPQWVRYLMLMLAGFFAGVAGGLTALNYEIVTAEVLSAHTSGMVILMAFVGGVGHFHGPVIGAALITVLQIAVSELTSAWPFYFGVFFLVIVLYAPGGIASIVAQHRRAWEAGLLRRLAPGYLRAAAPLLLLAGGTVTLVELAYALRSAAAGTGAARLRLRLLGLSLRADRPLSWLAGAAAVAAGAFLLHRAWRSVREGWQAVDVALREREHAAAPPAIDHARADAP